MIPLWNLYLLGPLLVYCLKSPIVDMRIYISTDHLNWWCYFLSRRRYVAWCAKINHLVLTLPRRLLHMLHWWSRIILCLIRSSTLSLFRWTLNCLDIIITSWCCFLMTGTDLISPLGQWMWNVVISRPNLINWKPMKHLLYGVVECVQKHYIMFNMASWTDLFIASTKKRLSSASSASVCPCNRTLGSGYFWTIVLSRVLV